MCMETVPSCDIRSSLSNNVSVIWQWNHIVRWSSMIFFSAASLKYNVKDISDRIRHPITLSWHSPGSSNLALPLSLNASTIITLACRSPKPPKLVLIVTLTMTFKWPKPIPGGSRHKYHITLTNEPHHVKTCLWDLWSGKTQTGLLSYRDYRYLEFWNFELSKYRYYTI